jgi:RNA polymerase sigma factor (sigma-70 family)
MEKQECLCSSTPPTLARPRPEDHVGLLFTCANRIRHSLDGLDLEPNELAAEAWPALVKAAQRWDPGRGIRFSSYAGLAVWHAMRRALSRWRHHRLQPLPESIEGWDQISPPDEAHLEQERRALVQWLLLQLDERSRRIVSMRFGIDGQPPRTWEEIADELRLSVLYVKALHAKATRQLRHIHQNTHR